MGYLLLVRMNDVAEGAQLPPNAVKEWHDDVDSRGKRLFGERLAPVAQATAVRNRVGRVVVTDGPFADAKEWIGGFDVLECDDLDDAIEIASRHPMVEWATIELRAFWPFEDDAEGGASSGGVTAITVGEPA